MAVKFDKILGALREDDSSSSSSEYNFSFETIAEDITVPLYQQMIVHGDIDIFEGFQLTCDGTIIIEE